MEDIFRSLILVAGVVLILFALHRVAVWMESRGWLYYRRVKPRSSNLGNAFLELQSMLEPGKRHVIELRREEHDDQTDSGDPPETGKK